jgi:hypothetical protein
MANEINTQYFSGTQASIFIGDVWVDDIFNLDYNMQQSKQPKFGYGSQHFDFVAKGIVMISGSFSLNFREPNYLWLILERYKKFNGKGPGGISRDTNEERKSNNINKAQTYAADKRDRFEDFFSIKNPKDAKNSLIEQSREFNGIVEDNNLENSNHIGFDILLGYGAELGPNSPGETLKDIQILGKAKTINADGRPIAETYSFIARRLV